MSQPNEIKLFGSVQSGFAHMVHHALKLKGVEYEYVNEDLKNKSEELLKMNPVYKKVPTLVVDGKPISESLVILQYIDETWPEPPLMPRDPYQRSKVRFWADFLYQKLVPGSYAIRQSEGEAQATAITEFTNNFKTLEDGINKDVHTEGPFIHGAKPGLLDVIIGPCHTGLKYLEKALNGVKLLDEERTPLLCAWMEEYAKLDVVKDTAEMLSQYASV